MSDEVIFAKEPEEGDEVFLLSDEAFDRLLAVLEDKAEPSPALAELLQRPNRWKE